MPAKSFDSRACGVLMYRRQIAVYFVIMFIIMFILQFVVLHVMHAPMRMTGEGGGVCV